MRGSSPRPGVSNGTSRDCWRTSNPVSIVVLDTDHRIVSCNPAFGRCTATPEDEVVGEILDHLITTPEKPA